MPSLTTFHPSLGHSRSRCPSKFVIPVSGFLSSLPWPNLSTFNNMRPQGLYIMHYPVLPYTSVVRLSALCYLVLPCLASSLSPPVSVSCISLSRVCESVDPSHLVSTVSISMLSSPCFTNPLTALIFSFICPRTRFSFGFCLLPAFAAHLALFSILFCFPVLREPFGRILPPSISSFFPCQIASQFTSHLAPHSDTPKVHPPSLCNYTHPTLTLTTN
jgi:hypothetical protein